MLARALNAYEDPEVDRQPLRVWAGGGGGGRDASCSTGIGWALTESDGHKHYSGSGQQCPGLPTLHGTYLLHHSRSTCCSQAASGWC